jgi:hypothetical protein
MANQRQPLGKRTLTFDELLKFADSDYRDDFVRRWDAENGSPVIGEVSKKFPDAEVGDCLFSYDIDVGLFRYVVTRLLDSGYVLVVRVSEPEELFQTERVAWISLYDSEAEAMEMELDEYRPGISAKLKFMDAAKRAISSGRNINKFLGGFDYD